MRILLECLGGLLFIVIAPILWVCVMVTKWIKRREWF